MKKLSRLLRLNRSEEKVLSFFLDNPSTTQHVAHISRQLSLPRMTCHDAIRLLDERGILSKAEEGYKINDHSNLVKSFSDLLKGVNASVALPRGEIMIHSGKSQCQNIWKKIADIPKGDRFKCIQPTYSIMESITKLGIGALYPSNGALNDKGIIVEGLVHEDCYGKFFDILAKSKGRAFARDELNKIAQRSSDIMFISKEYLNLPTELLFIHKSAYLINWKDYIAIEIHDRTLVDFLTELYKLVRGYGHKINVNTHIKDLLLKR